MGNNVLAIRSYVLAISLFRQRSVYPVIFEIDGRGVPIEMCTEMSTFIVNDCQNSLTQLTLKNFDSKAIETFLSNQLPSLFLPKLERIQIDKCDVGAMFLQRISHVKEFVIWSPYKSLFVRDSYKDIVDFPNLHTIELHFTECVLPLAHVYNLPFRSNVVRVTVTDTAESANDANVFIDRNILKRFKLIDETALMLRVLNIKRVKKPLEFDASLDLFYMKHCKNLNDIEVAVKRINVERLKAIADKYRTLNTGDKRLVLKMPQADFDSIMVQGVQFDGFEKISEEEHTITLKSKN